MPPLTTVQKIEIISKQGGPSRPRCGGVLSELTIDLVKNEWSRGVCPEASGDPFADSRRPLERRSGKLSPEQRALVETEYGKLLDQPGPSCAADAGPVLLTLHKSDGSSASFSSPGSSCSDAPPRVANDVRKFLSRVWPIASP